MSLRSPLGKAIGLGSAKHGFAHWWWQRVTAIALIPLSVWFLVSLLSLVGAPYAQVSGWLSNPFNACVVLLFMLTMLYHAQTGLQVVIEDYVHTKWINITLLLGVKFAAVVMAMLTVISVFKVVFGG